MSSGESITKYVELSERQNGNKVFTDEYIEDCDVVNEYEVTPMESVQILYDEDNSDYIYYVKSPELNEAENNVRWKVMDDIEQYITDIDVIQNTREEVIEELTDKTNEYIRKYITVEEKNPMSELNSITKKFGMESSDSNEYTFKEDSSEKILYFVIRDMARYERLTPLLQDDYIEDISCNGPNAPTFIYHSEHGDMESNVAYKEEELNLFVSMLAQRSGKHISVAQPNVAGRLPGGYRVQLTLAKEISPKGSNFTIRRFNDEPLTPVELIEYETFSLQQMAYLWLAIENNKSLIFAGGTASGKTTSMNAVSLFIPPKSKVVSIEDTQEITLQHSNWIQSVTRDAFGQDDSSEIGMYSLLRDALRQRPEYIIVGEVRGKEAQTLFQAMSTGHTTYSTMHADDVKSAINRLEHEPINLPRQMITALDIMSIQVRTENDGELVRRCKNLVEIGGIKAKNNKLEAKSIFEYDPETDNIKSKINDSNVLEEIKIIKNWTDEDVKEELNNRMKVLKYLKSEDGESLGYIKVTKILRRYMNNSNAVLKQIENGTLV